MTAEKLNMQFDQTYLINLKRREDRLIKWQYVNKSFIPLLQNLRYFEAIDGSLLKNTSWKHESGALGCLESHLAVLKDAKEQKFERILILEDDFVFDKDFVEKFNTGIEELPQNWDILYLYSRHFKPSQPHSSHLVSANAALGTVAYIINSKVIDLLISVLELREREVDVVYAHMHFLINAYCFKENICHHYDGYSDIINKLTDYHTPKKKGILKHIKSIFNKPNF